MKKEIMKILMIFVMAIIITAGVPQNIYATEKTPQNSEETTDKVISPQKSKKKPAVKKFEINAKNIEIKVGKSRTLKVKNATKRVKWESKNPNVAKVNKNGEVKAVKCGTTYILATSGDKTVKCKVFVFASKKYVNKWVKKKGRYYYYNKYGLKMKGLKEIDNKTYFFDEYGRQRVGWVDVGKHYCYFRIAEGDKGYRVSDKTVNQIKIDKNGNAIVKKANKRKIKVLVYSNDIVFDETDWRLTKEEALKKLYTGFATGKSISYKNIGGFKKGDGWPEKYAMIYLENGYGDCYTVGCAFAYLAVALGYKDVYAQSSGGHGWAKINGKFYDPNWAWWGTWKNGKRHIEKGYAQKGNNKKMAWKSCQKYSVKIG